MLSAVTVLLVLGFTAVFGLVDFAWVIAPVAKAALLVVPVTFMVSLIIGFAGKRRSWFE
jgi:hypothetical protein